MTHLDETCRLVSEHMSEVLDGVADEQLLDHVAECERCRDARFEAKRHIEQIRRAGDDFVAPADLEQRVLAALDQAAAPLDETGQADEVASPDETPPLEALPSDKERSTADAKRGRSVPRAWAVGLAGLGAAAAALALWLGRAGEPAPKTATGWSGTVSQVVSALGSARGLQICDAEAKHCAKAEVGQRLEAGARLRTDGLTRAKLSMADGSAVYLDRATDFQLSARAGRGGKLLEGNLVADVQQIEGRSAEIALPTGRAEVLGTKFALRVTDDFARVDVSRGEVKLVDQQERHVSVTAGEGAELYAGKAPAASALASLEEAMAWSDESFIAAGPTEGNALRGLGELVAKKPGETGERENAVRLTRHAVKVRAAGNIVKTTVEEVFSNTTDEVLEGIFRFPLPPDAQIERLALEVDGELIEGAFVDREQASKIWRGAIVNSTKQRAPIKEEIIWVPGPWKDPALLEWQRGGRFELRIFPIPKRGSRRIVLAYTQNIKPHGSVRRYTYPLAYDPKGSTEVADFSIDVQVRGHDVGFGVRPYGYELEQRKPTGELTELSYSRKNFVPSGDLSFEYRLEAEDRELRAWAYTPTSADLASMSAQGSQGLASAPSGVANDAPFVAMSLRPKLPRWTSSEHRAFVLAVDVSRSMFGEHYRRAIEVVVRIVREMDREDRVTLLACDTSCRKLPDGFLTPGAEAEAQARKFLETITPEGASDLVNTLVEAGTLGSAVGDRALRVIYVGDGTPTVGAVLPAFIRHELEQRLGSGTTVHAVTIGGDADRVALDAATEAGGGVVIPYSPGQSVASVAYAALGAAYGHTLRDISLELPEGLVEVAPLRLGPIAAGGEALVVARMLRPELSGKVRLRGTVGGRKYEQSFPLELRSTTAVGNAFVPRLFAATQIAELERSASAERREQIVALSRAFNVASRHTSLLVLESPAMFKAFGLDNTRAAPEWSGEDEMISTEADGEVRYEAPSLAPKPKGGLSAIASGAGSPAASAPAKRDAASEARRVVKPTDPLELPRRRLVPMRRIWEPTARIIFGDGVPKGGAPQAVRRAQAKVEENPLSRDALKELYIAQLLSGDLEQARQTAERWSTKDPLDPDALTARADIAAQLGDRASAIRILGSVIDMRPDDHKAQWRLARLQRWQGQPKLGCRYSSAVAQMRPSDVDLVTLALRCARDTGDSALYDDLWAMAPKEIRAKLERALQQNPKQDELAGEFRIEASWGGAAQDLDLVILHPDGYRVSWLGAPTRAVISARDVLSTSGEGLALKGAKPGSYAIELVRDAGAAGTVRGDIKIRVGKQVQSLPFSMNGSRLRVATVELTMKSRLVPVN